MAQVSLPQQFGKYLLVKKIAVGGMAEIFLAKVMGAQGFQKDIVIKRILPSYSEDEQFVSMFIDEARIAARLNHPNIVQIYDFDKVDDSFYIAMEYMEAGDLRRAMDRGLRTGNRLTPTQCAHLIGQVAGGLHYAHSRIEDDGTPLSIVHRDMSPHNVMLTVSGDAKVTDFGIAKAAARSTKTQVGTVKGKCAYMAPEQARGRDLDGRTDQFAVAIILWEMLVGRKPFEGDSDFDTLNKILNESPPPPSVFNPVVPRELDVIVMKALRKDREERFPDMAAFEKELRGFAFKHAQSMDELSLGEYLRGLAASVASADGATGTAQARGTGSRSGAASQAVPRPVTGSSQRAATGAAPRGTPGAGRNASQVHEGTLLMDEESGSSANATVAMEQPGDLPATQPVGELQQQVNQYLANQGASGSTRSRQRQVVSNDEDVATLAISKSQVQEAWQQAQHEAHRPSSRVNQPAVEESVQSQQPVPEPVSASRRVVPWIIAVAAVLVAGVVLGLFLRMGQTPDAPLVAGSTVAADVIVAAPVPDHGPVASVGDAGGPAAAQDSGTPAKPTAVASTVSVVVTPASATVKLDDRTILAVKGERVVEGRYKVGDEVRVAASASGYKDFASTVKIADASETISIKLDAVPKAGGDPAPRPPAAVAGTGRVTINARPWADVYYKGRKIGTTPVRNFEVPAGKATFTLKNQVTSKTISVTVAKDGNVSQVVDM